MIYKQQGGFTEKVENLKNFEDCYVRAQFEMMEMAKDEKTIKDPAELEKKKQERKATILAALQQGMKLAADAKSHDEGLELGNAKAMLAFQYLNDKKYREAIAIAEPFAHSDPRSAQAADCAVYALQCYAEMVGNAEANGRSPEELKPMRDRLFKP